MKERVQVREKKKYMTKTAHWIGVRCLISRRGEKNKNEKAGRREEGVSSPSSLSLVHDVEVLNRDLNVLLIGGNDSRSREFA